jgi:hypothetical protein
VRIISLVIETDLSDAEVKNKIELALDENGSVRMLMPASAV